MHAFEVEYLIFGGFNIVACLTMVITYSLTNPWWRTHLGRMLVTYALVEMSMATLLLVTVVFHTAPHWFRAVWFALQVIAGCTFWFQTTVIYRLHHQRVRETQHGRAV